MGIKVKKTAKRKICFIICPVGKENSNTRRNTDSLINQILKPVIEKLNYKIIPTHDIAKPGSISRQIIEYLLSADLVIAILNELNPNVMYELAVRHGKGLPSISIATAKTKLPFDLKDERTILYEDTVTGAKILKQKLKSAIKDAENEKEPDNPIYRVSKDGIMKELIAKSSDTQKYILQRLEEMNWQLSTISSRPIRSLKKENTQIRPGEINAEVFHFTYHNIKFLAFIGILNDKPFEIFTMEADDFYLPSWVQNGLIIKSLSKDGKERYDFRYTDKDKYSITIEGLSRFSIAWYPTSDNSRTV